LTDNFHTILKNFKTELGNAELINSYKEKKSESESFYYRGIVLLEAAYKIVAILLLNCLQSIEANIEYCITAFPPWTEATLLFLVKTFRYGLQTIQEKNSYNLIRSF
jgi:hypothetical protein